MIFEKHCPLPQAVLVVDMRSGRIGTDSEDLSGGSLLHAQIEPLDYSLLSMTITTSYYSESRLYFTSASCS